MSTAPENAFKEKSTKLLIILPLRTIYFRTFQCETPSNTLWISALSQNIFLHLTIKQYKATMGVIETITEFGNETTIHGLSYVVKSPSSTIRRIIWILFFVGSMIYAVVLLQAAVICNNYNTGQASTSCRLGSDKLQASRCSSLEVVNPHYLNQK